LELKFRYALIKANLHSKDDSGITNFKCHHQFAIDSTVKTLLINLCVSQEITAHCSNQEAKAKGVLSYIVHEIINMKKLKMENALALTSTFHE
jgi:hypothetical protein